MSRIHRFAAIAAAFSFTAAVHAADGNKPKDEGRICTLETVVGSHMPKRICTTAAEREASHQNAQQNLSEMQNFAKRTSIGPAGR